MKSKIWYSSGNIFKVKFRKHYCFKCGEELNTKKHSKVVHSKSDEAKYYDFTYGETSVRGNCEFIHKIFYCSNCSYDIEYLTQIGMEDYVQWEKKAFDLINRKVVKCFDRQISLKKIWLDDENEEHIVRPDLEKISCYIVRISDLNVDIVCAKRYQSKYWERPYFLSKNPKFKSELKKVKKSSVIST